MSPRLPTFAKNKGAKVAPQVTEKTPLGYTFGNLALLWCSFHEVSNGCEAE